LPFKTEVKAEAFNDNLINLINNEESNGIIYGPGENDFDYTKIVSYGGINTDIDFIPETVEYIGNKTFFISHLTSVKIPDSVNYIGMYAFAYNNITELTLPEWTELGSAAFTGNDIELINNEISNGIIFERANGKIDYTTINSYAGESRDIDFIPLSVESINPQAFQACYLNSLILPESVQSVGAYAFAFNNLISLEVEGDNPSRLLYALQGYEFDHLLSPSLESQNTEGTSLVVFVTFADQANFTPSMTFSEYDELFNGDVSLEDYIEEISYGQYLLDVKFLGDDFNFYVDDMPMGYYLRSSSTNSIGYNNETEERNRMNELIQGMTDWIEEEGFVTDSSVLDQRGDGAIDNLILFHVGEGGWGDLLWPKQGLYFGPNVSIGDKDLLEYSTLSLGNPNDLQESSLSVYAHEFMHVLTAPDYYMYSEPFYCSLRECDIMASGGTMLHPTQYVKEEYFGWDIDKIVVNETGEYTINHTQNSEDNLILIELKKEYENIYLEFRMNTGKYENNLPDRGVIAYRVNDKYYGNDQGVYNDNLVGVEEIHVYRPSIFDEELLANEGKYVILPIGDIDNRFAYSSANAAMNFDSYTKMGVGTNVPLYYSNGVEIPIYIELLSINDDEATLFIDYVGEQ